MTAAPIAISALDPPALAQNLERLSQILHACVHEGASVGFILPFEIGEARAFWRDKVAPSQAAGSPSAMRHPSSWRRCGRASTQPARRRIASSARHVSHHDRGRYSDVALAASK
jgi:hypothetical protein